MSRIRKVILINSLKGGVGKTSVAFCLIKYLASLKKQVKVFDFDGLNHGLSAILKTYLPKKLTPFVTTDDKGSIEFFRRSMKYVADVYNEFDYIAYKCSFGFFVHIWDLEQNKNLIELDLAYLFVCSFQSFFCD